MDVNPQREPVLAYNMILSFIRSGLIMLIALNIIVLNELQMEAVLAFFAAGSLVVDRLSERLRAFAGRPDAEVQEAGPDRDQRGPVRGRARAHRAQAA